MSAERARQLGVQLVPDDRGARRARPTSSPCTSRRHPRRSASSTPRFSPRPNRACASSTPRAAGSSTRPRWPPRSATGTVAGAAIDVFAQEPTTESPLFELDSVVVTPHLGASTVEAQDKAGNTIAEQVVLALNGEFVPFAVNVAASEASETLRPYLPLAERLGRLFTALAGGRARDRRRELRGRDRRLRLPRAHPVGAEGPALAGRRRAGHVRQRAAARGGARRRRPLDQLGRRPATT